MATRNKVEGGPWTHPFHIHVNPFEVVSIRDDKNVERLTRPVWRDTLAIPDGWTFKLRTRYQDFTGDFVQHCHILAHEDWGMMELIRIVRPGQAGLGGPVPEASVAWALPDAAGTTRKSAEFAGRTSVLVFSKGYGCVHCAEQIRVFSEQADQFKKRGVDVVFISTDSVKSLAAARGDAAPPFVLLADADCKVFRSYGCYRDEPLHGAFLIDSAGKILWHSIASGPLLSVEPLLRAMEKGR